MRSVSQKSSSLFAQTGSARVREVRRLLHVMFWGCWLWAVGWGGKGACFLYTSAENWLGQGIMVVGTAAGVQLRSSRGDSNQHSKRAACSKSIALLVPSGVLQRMGAADTALEPPCI